MISTKEQIAARLEQAFNNRGFAEPSVAELQRASGTTLRTLYRHFPSKEAMVIGALHYRHARYFAFLAENEPPPGKDSIIHLFNRLAVWMTSYAPHGCLYLNALTSFPDNKNVRDATMRYKNELIQVMAVRSCRKDLSHELFLLHEGVSAAWPIVGKQAIHSAIAVAEKIMEGENNE
ncbi:TetR/AcrR family transcriptional regulator [Desulforhopalus sp. IMCC35007]|uniref:TetR/AcrR family transcriptional regulator n=1 Tax=Desulforhopalus sp. IMCC35007 TaxID=2569543 RepID=UPI00197AB232|nr:TetR/AcrR family transcriptional regulator [Desulforhopalus sp. IMCC35007]